MARFYLPLYAHDFRIGNPEDSRIFALEPDKNWQEFYMKNLGSLPRTTILFAADSREGAAIYESDPRFSAYIIEPSGSGGLDLAEKIRSTEGDSSLIWIASINEGLVEQLKAMKFKHAYLKGPNAENPEFIRDIKKELSVEPELADAGFLYLYSR